MASRVPSEDKVPAELLANFGKYNVVRELGRGGMGRVLEARHPHLGTQVALKVMLPSLAEHPLAAARFLREAKAASQIRHDHVVTVFDIGTQDGLPFIVMEFLEGQDLAALLVDRVRLPLSEIVDIFLPILSAVHAAHQLGIVHRDLKPANVMMIRRAGRASPKVLDFGISKSASDDVDAALTRSESLLGTVRYMAPELTKGAKFASEMSDQYALGVMLYECATGRRPFVGDSYYDLMHAIVTAPVAPPSHFQPGLPPDFDSIVLRAIDRAPTKRFPSIEALGSALLSFGSKAAWAIWEAEFIYASAGRSETLNSASSVARHASLQPPEMRTLSDDPAAYRWQRRARRTIVALGLYAIVATTLLGRAVLRRKLGATVATSSSDPVRPSSSLALVAPSAVPPAMSGPLSNAVGVASALAIHGAPELSAPIPTTSAAPTRPSPTAGSGPPKISPAKGRMIEVKESAGRSVIPAASAGPKASPVLGTNAAPIYD